MFSETVLFEALTWVGVGIASLATYLLYRYAVRKKDEEDADENSGQQ